MRIKSFGPHTLHPHANLRVLFIRRSFRVDRRRYRVWQLKRVLGETKNGSFAGRGCVQARGSIGTVSFEALCTDRCKQEGGWKQST